MLEKSEWANWSLEVEAWRAVVWKIRGARCGRMFRRDVARRTRSTGCPANAEIRFKMGRARRFRSNAKRRILVFYFSSPSLSLFFSSFLFCHGPFANDLLNLGGGLTSLCFHWRRFSSMMKTEVVVFMSILERSFVLLVLSFSIIVLSDSSNHLIAFGNFTGKNLDWVIL